MFGRRNDKTKRKIVRNVVMFGRKTVRIAVNRVWIGSEVVRAEGNRVWTGSEVVRAEDNRVWTGNEVVVNVVGKAVAVKPRASGGN